MNTRNQTSQQSSNQRGATAVEFAVLALLLLTILFGLLEFGMIFFQKHYIANAAREAVRTGVRADNYECYEPAPDCNPDFITRSEATFNWAEDYLDNFYDTSAPDTITVTRQPLPSEPIDPDNPRRLSVTVRVENFMPGLASALVPIYDSPEHLTHTATGEYENPEEE